MKNLFTLLLLVVSFLAVGQTNNTSEEIKYWKSIADSNDTVTYRQYLNRYGETGLYYDEAITRITLLKTSGKQVQFNSPECFYYTPYTICYIWYEEAIKNVEYVVRFNGNKDKVWFKRTYYDTIRSNLSISRDFYESQATIALSRGTREYKNAIWNDKKAIDEAEYAKKYEKNRRKKSEILQKAEQAKSPEYYKNAWTADEEYEYDPMKSTSARDVYFKRDIYYTIHGWHPDKFYYVFSVDYYLNYSHSDEYHDYRIVITKPVHRYIAFSKDKSSFIMWFEEDDNLDGQIFNKKEYNRIPKEELLPKKVNYDFLNE